ncbi:MAG: hypothetical protein ACXWBQ_06540 [Usitatibacter sp.]
MKRASAVLLVAMAGAAAGEDGRRASPPATPDWEVSLTAYPTHVRGGEDSTPAIGAADRGPLHLEARYGYEAIDARSAFVGWTFSGGDAVSWELTPLIGGAWGPLHAFVPGFEASVAWKRLDFYVEAEFVRDRGASADSYNYAWSELGFRAFEWLRVGAVAQRTRLYGGERQFQRGPFVQASFGRATLGGYWFNPGSKEEVVMASIGVKF